MSITARRLRNQHLTRPAADVEQVVRRLCAVQGQEVKWAFWGIASRTTSASAADVAEAYNEGRILRTHAMRPTWHFVHRDDLRLVHAATAERVHRACTHQYKKRGLEDALRARSARIFAEAVTGGRHITRAEAAEILDESGITASGPVLALLLISAEVDCVLTSGRMRGKQHTWAAFDERVPASDPLTRDEACTELARRWVDGHGPAVVEDLAWWSGMTKLDANRALAACGSKPVHHGGEEWWSNDRRASRKESALLLPIYDEYLIAYRKRDPVKAPLAPEPRPGFFFRNIAVVDGCVAGAWRADQRRQEVHVHVELLAGDAQALHPRFVPAAQRFGAHLGKDITLTVERVA